MNETCCAHHMFEALQWLHLSMSRCKGFPHDTYATAGETAASCGVLEREVVFLLCGHAAKRALDTPLVQAALDMLAARLGYASRTVLMAYHKQTLIFDWCCSGYSLQQFLSIQVQAYTL